MSSGMMNVNRLFIINVSMLWREFNERINEKKIVDATPTITKVSVFGTGSAYTKESSMPSQ